MVSPTLSSCATRTPEREWRCVYGAARSSRPGWGILRENPAPQQALSSAAERGPTGLPWQRPASMSGPCLCRREGWIQGFQVQNKKEFCDRHPWRCGQPARTREEKWHHPGTERDHISADVKDQPFALELSPPCVIERGKILNFTETIPKNKFVLKTGNSKST